MLRDDAKGGGLCHFQSEKSKQLPARHFSAAVALHSLLPSLKRFPFIRTAQKEVVGGPSCSCMREQPRREFPQLFTELSLPASTLDMKEAADALCEESLGREVLGSNHKKGTRAAEANAQI